jgi:Tol biopolymer transport system component
LPGRLVVLGTTGGVSLSLGDEFLPLEVTPGGIAQQPTWAPDGGSVAWAEFDASGAAAVAVGRSDGSAVTRYDAPFGPFYFYWSPDASRLAFLGGNPIGLGLLDLSDGSIEVVDGGQPYYFDWSPDGTELVTHVGGEGLSVGVPGQAARPIEPSTGAFLAPEWIPGQTAIVYVRAAAGTGDDGVTASAGGGLAAQTGVAVQQLMRLDLDGGTPAVLVEFSGRISFDVSPDGSAIAFSVTRGAEPLNFGPLTVLDLESGEQRSISPGPVLAYEWSPDSTTLALLAPSEDQLAVRWGVGGGGDEVEWFSPFIPTSTYSRAYLPFFDQYARSSTMWSPDGSTIVFTAVGPEGDEVWLQPVTGGDPDVLGPGSVASFARP